jgi:hypothetical protein
VSGDVVSAGLRGDPWRDGGVRSGPGNGEAHGEADGEVRFAIRQPPGSPLRAIPRRSAEVRRGAEVRGGHRKPAEWCGGARRGGRNGDVNGDNVHLEVDDPVRTVAAVLESPAGSLLVYGTVLPWHSDPGPDPACPSKAWREQDRVLPLQLAEWGRLGARFPDAPLVVAGDLNMNLGGPHYYGTARGRRQLREGLAELGLACATETDRVPAGSLVHPPIDHVLVPDAWAPRTRVVSAWEGTTAAGMRLSDHSGLVVEVTHP